MRAVVIGNSGDDDAGFVGDQFVRRGVRLDRWERENPGNWPALDHDMVLLLGSEWSVYWDRVAKEVAAETAVITAAHARGVPVLGICFGGQMLAVALGGTVAAAPRPELGWCEIDSDIPDVISPGPWLQWHGDAFTVPPGARELARSAVCPQAFVAGRALGVQFHPEVTPATLERWSEGAGGHYLEEVGIDLDVLAARTQEAAPTSEAHARTLVDWYLDTVAG